MSCSRGHRILDAMAGKRPGPDPTGKMVRQASVALRDGDQDALQRLAAERLILEVGGDPKMLWEVVARGNRPSASAGIRRLIDDEHSRRVEASKRRWRESHPSEPLPKDAQLLRDDYVFGSPGGPKVPNEFLYRLEPYAIVDGTLQRAHTHELGLVDGALMPVPRNKGKRK